jgi:hypothetical protein
VNQSTKYWTKQVKSLCGGVIQNPIFSPGGIEFGDELWGFEVKLPNGKTKLVWVLMDEEGNGPGALDIVNKE